jgi:hypothetical protein
MEKRHRLTFDFAGAQEIQYTADLPELGDYVIHEDVLWVVSTVEEHDLGVRVTCEPTRADALSDVSERGSTL